MKRERRSDFQSLCMAVASFAFLGGCAITPLRAEPSVGTTTQLSSADVAIPGSPTPRVGKAHLSAAASDASKAPPSRRSVNGWK